MEDDKIIDLFWMRDQTAIQETNTKYGGKLQRLAIKILYSQEDAEESVNDTYLSAWNAIPPQRPDFCPASSPADSSSGWPSGGR